MTTDESCPLYEEEALQQVTGETIRPGGLALTEKALATCTLPARARLLDLGCGLGVTLEHLIFAHGFVAVGCDLSARLLREGQRRRPRLSLIQAQGECLPIISDGLDAVLTECTLSATAEPERVLEECRRVLRPGGVLIMSDVYVRNPLVELPSNSLPPVSFLANAWSQPQIVEALRSKGFQIVWWEDYSSTLKDMAVQCIFSHGSLEPIRRSTSVGQASPADWKKAFAQSRPGYFLLTARKESQK